MTNNKQQTAVEWLQSIELERDLTLTDWKQAKEMEKEQIKSALYNGYLYEGSMPDNECFGEQYYNAKYADNK